ncbi:MAG TPA: hypothetical protein PLI60_05680, partial [Anaerolineaceae bacterium]|nr:hypothetical protein [Anaerolineaceae bacterium]
LDANDLAARLVPFFEKEGFAVDFDKLVKIIPILQVRIATLDEAPQMAGFFFKDEVKPELEDLIAKGLTAAESAAIAERCLQELCALDDISPEKAEPHMREVVEAMGYSAGQVFGIMRVAITGQKVSPPLFESMEIIGKDTVFKRLEKAITQLRQAL